MNDHPASCGSGKEGKKKVNALKHLLITALFVAWAPAAHAAIIIVGDHEVEPGSIADIMIMIQREPTDPDLLGLSLVLQISEGTTLAGPAIDTVDLVSGTIFAPNNDGSQDNGSDIDPPQQAFWDVLVNDIFSPIVIPTNGLLATVRVNAAGLTERTTYNLTVSSFTANAIALNTLLIDDSGQPLTPTVNDGTLTVTPEPAAFALWAAYALLAFSTHRSRPKSPSHRPA